MEIEQITEELIEEQPQSNRKRILIIVGIAALLLLIIIVWNVTRNDTLAFTITGNGAGAIRVQDMKTGNVWEVATGGADTVVRSFNRGSVLKISAIPDNRSEFIGWNSSLCQGNGDCTITLKTDMLLNVQFTSTRLMGDFDAQGWVSTGKPCPPEQAIVQVFEQKDGQNIIVSDTWKCESDVMLVQANRTDVNVSDLIVSIL